MRLQRTITFRLTEEQAETLNAIGFLHRTPWTQFVRLAISNWLDLQAKDPDVVEAKRAVARARAYSQGHRQFDLIKGGAE